MMMYGSYELTLNLYTIGIAFSVILVVVDAVVKLN